MYWQRRAGETWPSRANSPWSVTSPDRNQLFRLYGPVPELVQSDADTPLARKRARE